MKNIGERAFANCANLNEVTLNSEEITFDFDVFAGTGFIPVSYTNLSYPYMTTVLQSIVDGTFDKPKSKQAKGGFLNYTERKDLDENDLNMIKKRREYIAKGEA